MHKPQAKIILMPAPSEAALAERRERNDQIETAMNAIGAIIPLLHETVEGNRFLLSRVWLAEELDRNYAVLNGLLEGIV